MKRIFYTFLSRPVTAGMFFLSIVVLGLVSVFNLPVELSPHVEYPKLSVYCNWYGASPVTMEASITSPLESELATLKGLKKISSISSKNNATIELEFYDGTNMDMTRLDINEMFNVLRDEFPYGVSFGVSNYIPDDLQDLQGFLTYTISGNQSANVIQKYVKDNVIYPLKAIKGVSDVEVYGGNQREITILVDYKKASALGITNYQIQQAVSNSEKISFVGTIKQNGYQYFLKLNNTVKSVATIENQPIKYLNDGNVILIKDIASVTDDYTEARRYFRINGKETVTLAISKEIGANSLEVAENVGSKIEQLSKDFPQGYVIVKEMDKTEDIEKQLSELFNSALFSLIIIVLVLIAIFRSFRYSVVIILSIFFSLLFSFVLFYLFELPLNILTISAFVLGFGFMVDNSIVVVDFIDKHYKKDGLLRLTIVLRNIFFPVFASTLTTIAVFIPLLFFSGELKLYFSQFALGVLFTLIASMIVAFTIIPLCYVKFNLGYRIKLQRKASQRGEKVYSFIIEKLFKWKKLSIILLIWVIGLPVWLIPTSIKEPGFLAGTYNSIFGSDTYSEIKPYINYGLGGTLNLFFNHINRGEFWTWGAETYIRVYLRLPNGNNIERINSIVKDFEAEILNYKNNFKTLSVSIYSEEKASLNIHFTPKQGMSIFPYQLKNYLIAYATRMGGLSVSVQGYGQGFSNGGGSGSSSSFRIGIKGFNFQKVKDLALDFQREIEKNKRVPKESIDISSGRYWNSKDSYEIVGQINREKLATEDISIRQLFYYLNSNTRGNLSGTQFKIGNQAVIYNIKYSNYKNIQLDELKDLIVRTNGGQFLKVADVIDFNTEKVMSSIEREDQQYIRTVAYDYRGPWKYGNKALEKAISKLTIPEGYSVEKRNFMYFGTQQESQVWIILLASIILILMVTSSLFESFKKAGIILIAIPFAVIGTIFIFYLGDYSLNRGAYAGILLLIGLSVNNSIILVDYLSQFGTITSIKELAKISYARLRPIFTTTLTTIAALIPLLFGADASFWKNLSISVMSGIFLSSLVVILYVPVFYHIVTTIKKKR